MDRSKRFSIPMFILVVSEALSYAGGEATCNAPKVAKGSSAKITCSFDKNTPRMQENIFMEHLTFSAYDHEIVVSCQLVEGRYICRCNDGYQVIGTVKDMLTVEIPSALPQHAGIYWCGGFEPHPLERTHCKLNVTGMHKYILKENISDNVNLNYNVPDASNSKLSPTENAYEQGKMKEDIVPLSTVTAIIAVTMTTGVVCALVITIFVIWRRRARKTVEKDFTERNVFLQPSIYVGDENLLTKIQYK